MRAPPRLVRFVALIEELGHIVGVPRACVRRAPEEDEVATDPERILDYFNNYNGGIINQVQPQVDNEVTPLVTKIGKNA